MAFIDEAKFHIKAGRGGNGVVRWRREKFIDMGGPNGGDGGRGGDVYLRAVRDIGLLFKYKNEKEFAAENGEPGGGTLLTGKGGDDLVIDFPIGTIITNVSTGATVELVTEGQKVLLLKGGDGGFGNTHFKSSTNRAPREWTPGKEGEEGDFTVELRLFADIGLVGLPNAGKSSLLNVVTNAQAKVGNYQFTTLEPNLGNFFGYIIADIPGLIEGASEGRGLGMKFLRHIRRTKMLAHLVSFENEDMMKAYKEIRNELEKYSTELANKEEIIVLTKTDVVPEDTVKEMVKKFEKETKKKVLILSLFDDNSIKDFSAKMMMLLQK